jgi:LPXTG-motif cell wall-anchored protein
VKRILGLFGLLGAIGAVFYFFRRNKEDDEFLDEELD